MASDVEHDLVTDSQSFLKSLGQMSLLGNRVESDWTQKVMGELVKDEDPLAPLDPYVRDGETHVIGRLWNELNWQWSKNWRNT